MAIFGCGFQIFIQKFGLSTFVDLCPNGMVMSKRWSANWLEVSRFALFYST